MARYSLPFLAPMSLAGASATFAVALDDALGWIGRDELNRNVANNFIDEEL